MRAFAGREITVTDANGDAHVIGIVNHMSEKALLP
jgi:hypothetical protein